MARRASGQGWAASCVLFLSLLFVDEMRTASQHRARGRGKGEGVAPGNPSSLSCGRLTNHEWRTAARRDLEGSRIAPHQAPRWAGLLILGR